MVLLRAGVYIISHMSYDISRHPWTLPMKELKDEKGTLNTDHRLYEELCDHLKGESLMVTEGS